MLSFCLLQFYNQLFNLLSTELLFYFIVLILLFLFLFLINVLLASQLSFLIQIIYAQIFLGFVAQLLSVNSSFQILHKDCRLCVLNHLLLNLVLYLLLQGFLALILILCLNYIFILVTIMAHLLLIFICYELLLLIVIKDQRQALLSLNQKHFKQSIFTVNAHSIKPRHRMVLKKFLLKKLCLIQSNKII